MPPTYPSPNWIFVFGSNLASHHGAGAALTAARFYGAKRGVAEGLEGKSYALPTKDAQLKTLSIARIRSSTPNDSPPSPARAPIYSSSSPA